MQLSYGNNFTYISLTSSRGGELEKNQLASRASKMWKLLARQKIYWPDLFSYNYFYSNYKTVCIFFLFFHLHLFLHPAPSRYPKISTFFFKLSACRPTSFNAHFHFPSTRFITKSAKGNHSGRLILLYLAIAIMGISLKALYLSFWRNHTYSKNVWYRVAYTILIRRVRDEITFFITVFSLSALRRQHCIFLSYSFQIN